MTEAAAKKGIAMIFKVKRLNSVLAALTLAAVLSMGSIASAQTVASSYTYAKRLDVAGREVGTIAPDPDGAGTIAFAATRTTFDANGLITRVEVGELSSWQSETIAPSVWTGFTVFRYTDYSYDGWGRKIMETSYAQGAVQGMVQYSYDATGRLDCTAQRMNPTFFRHRNLALALSVHEVLA
jgi:hypothetical protein